MTERLINFADATKDERSPSESSTQKGITSEQNETLEPTSAQKSEPLPNIIYIPRNFNKATEKRRLRTPPLPIYFDETFPSILEQRVNEKKIKILTYHFTIIC
jgi:hypothetical protein